MNRVKMSLALLCAVVFSGAVLAQTPAEVTEKFNKAGAMLGEGKVAEAIPVLEGVIAQGLDAGPEASEIVKQAKVLLPECYRRQGLGFASAKDFDQAMVALTKADDLADLYNATEVKAKIAGPLAKIYMIDGGQAFNEKNYAKAIDIFSKAYAKFPNNTDMALLLAKSYAESGDMAKGAEVYKNIIDLKTKHDKYAEPAAKAKTELTQYMLIDASKAAEANDLAGVVAATDAIFAFDPTNGAAYMMRLQSATNAKDYDAVIAIAEPAVAAQTDVTAQSNANFLVGAAYQNKENKAKAIESYKKVAAGPNVATAKTQITELSK